MRSEVQYSLLHRGWCEKFIPLRRTKVRPHSPLRVNCCRNDAVLSVSSSDLYLRGRLPGLLKMLEHKLVPIRSWHVMIPFFSTCQTFTLKELVVAADRGRQAGATNLGSRWSTSYLWAQWRAQLSCLCTAFVCLISARPVVFALYRDQSPLLPFSLWLLFFILILLNCAPHCLLKTNPKLSAFQVKASTVSWAMYLESLFCFCFMGFW